MQRPCVPPRRSQSASAAGPTMVPARSRRSQGGAAGPRARHSVDDDGPLRPPVDANLWEAARAIGASWGHLSRSGHLMRRTTKQRQTKVPGKSGSLGGAAYRNRTDDLRITRGTIPVRARASCTDSTGNRTDGTHGAGIIRRPGPRTGPRPRPLRPRLLLLSVNLADDMDPRPQADKAPGRRVICMPLRTQSG